MAIETPGDSDRLTLDIEEAAKLLGIGRKCAYAAARSGGIPTIQIGRRRLVPKAALMRLIDSAGGAA